jgi:glycosyltransferase involved in cell wall biosynthesis
MRIAHFIHRYPPAVGGSESWFARLSRQFAAWGDDVTIFTTNALDLDAFWSRRGCCVEAGTTVEDGVTVERHALWRAPCQRWLLRGLSLVPGERWRALTMSCNPLAPTLWRAAGRAGNRFDVVHAGAFPYAFVLLCARRLARALGVPFVLTPFLHTGDPDDPRDRTRRNFTRPALLALARDADLLLIQTATERRAFLDLGFPPEKLVLQGLGVEPAECSGGDRTATRRAWGVGPETVVIGHLANHSAEKGTIDLLNAARQLWGRGVNAMVVLAGPEMPSFRRFWRGFAHSERVRRLGVLSEEGKRDFLAGIDVFALPSRVDSFGLVLLEAWANGVPCVAYRAGGVADVIRHERDGLLVGCGDVAALGAALARLAADTKLRHRLGTAGSERLPRDFAWDDKLALVRHVYARAVAVPSSLTRKAVA